MTDLIMPLARPVAGDMMGLSFATRSFDFLTHGLPSGLAFSRASSGTITNSSGVLEVLGTALPRFDYAPSTHAPQGILMEQASTNYARATNDFSNAFWTKWQSTLGSTTNGPDGTASLVKVIPTAVSGTHVIQKVLTLTVGDYWVASYYVKASDYTKCAVYARSSGFSNVAYVRFDLESGGVITSGTSGNGIINGYGCEDVGNGIFRVWLAARTSATDTSAVFEFQILNSAGTSSFTGDGTSGLYMGCAQFERGPYVDQPTSYIPNAGTGADATRASDTLGVSNLLQASWFNHHHGTLILDFDVHAVGTHNVSHRLAEFYLNTDNRLLVTYNPNDTGCGLKTLNIVSGTLVSTAAPTLPKVARTRRRVAMDYTSDTLRLSVDGSAIETAAIGGLGEWNQLNLGWSASGAFGLNGHLYRAIYMPQAGYNLQQLSEI